MYSSPSHVSRVACGHHILAVFSRRNSVVYVCSVFIRLPVVYGKIVALEKNRSCVVDRGKWMARNIFLSSSERIVSFLNPKLCVSYQQCDKLKKKVISDRHDLK